MSGGCRVSDTITYIPLIRVLTSLILVKWLGVISGGRRGSVVIKRTVPVLSGRTINGNKLNPEISAFLTWLSITCKIVFYTVR